MNKLLLSAVLMGFLAVSFAQPDEQGQNRPVIYENLRGTFIGRIMDRGCTVRDLLKDSDFSNTAYKILDTAREALKNGRTCAKDFLSKALSDPNSNVAKIISGLKNGFNMPGGFNPIMLFFSLQSAFQGVDISKAIDEAKQGFQGLLQECGGPALETIKPDFQHLRDLYMEAKAKNSGTSGTNPSPNGERSWY